MRPGWGAPQKGRCLPLPVQEEPSYRGRGKKLYLGDTGGIWFRILLTSFCKNDAQTPLPKGAPLRRGRPSRMGTPSVLPFFISLPGTSKQCQKPGICPDRSEPEGGVGIPGPDADSSLTVIAGCDDVVSRPTTSIFRGYDCPAYFAEMGRHFHVKVSIDNSIMTDYTSASYCRLTSW